MPLAPVCDRGKLVSALNRIRHYHMYEGVTRLTELAALYIVSIVKAHAFPDGNKRTALLAASLFLMDNGLRLEESEKLPQLIIDAASGHTKYGELAIILEKHIRRF